MSNVLEFKPKLKRATKPFYNPKQSFWQSYKEVLRKFYSENDVHLIVAAIMDSECYERTNDDIRKVVDVYYRLVPSI